MLCTEDLLAVQNISDLESHARTSITVTPSRVPADVEQALFSVTDVVLSLFKSHTSLQLVMAWCHFALL